MTEFVQVVKFFAGVQQSNTIPKAISLDLCARSGSICCEGGCLENDEGWPAHLEWNMSSSLRNCLMVAISVAFGTALLSFIFGIVTVAILGAVTGPGDVIAVGAALPILLAAAFIFGAAVFVAQVVGCIVADNQRSANVQAGAPGGGGQALEGDEKAPRCRICEMMHQLVLVGSVVGILIGVILSRA